MALKLSGAVTQWRKCDGAKILAEIGAVVQWRNNLKCGARPALEDRIGKEGVDREGGYDRERGSGKRGRIGSECRGGKLGRGPGTQKLSPAAELTLAGNR